MPISSRRSPPWYRRVIPTRKLRGPKIAPALRDLYVASRGTLAITARHFFLEAESKGRPASPGGTLDLFGDSPAGVESPDPTAGFEPGDPDRWEAGWVPISATIETEPNARLVGVLIVAGDGHVLRMTPQIDPPADPVALARVFAREVDQEIAKEGKPAEVWVRDQASATALRRLPSMRGVVIEIRESLPNVEQAGESLAQHLGGPTATGLATSAPSWAGWGIEPALVAELFRAAAALYRAAPWRHYGDGDPLTVRWPNEGEWVIAVMGASKIERGLLCFDDPRDLAEFASGTPSPKSFRGQMVSISFSPLDDLPPVMRKEIMTKGWEVAAPEAYPMVMVMNAPTAGLTPETAERLREVIDVVARFAGTKARRRVASWRDRATGIVVLQD